MREEWLKALCALDGPSGREHAVRAYILSVLAGSPVPHTVTVDTLGNVTVSLKGEQPAPKKLMFAAHMDEVGLIVTHIEKDGTLRFATVGGIDEKALFGKRVRIGDVKGVIGGKAYHHSSEEERQKVPSVKTMCIDIGAASAEEAASRISLGDEGTFDSEWSLLGADKIRAKALDDRAGCALLLEMAYRRPVYDITLCFTVQEEVGLRGAATAGFAVAPDFAVVIDVTTASDLSEVEGADRVCVQGEGPVVSFMDGRTLYDAPFYHRIRRLAQEIGVPSQTKTRIAGGNDAGSIQTAGGGCRVAAVSLAGRYIHSAGPVVDRRDLEATARLLAAIPALMGESF